MRENLDHELGGNVEQAKLKWYKINKINDLTTVGSLILIAYRRFVSSLFPTVLDYEDQVSLDDLILSELSTRSDLNSYDREAFHFALKFNTTMI